MNRLPHSGTEGLLCKKECFFNTSWAGAGCAHTHSSYFHCNFIDACSHKKEAHLWCTCPCCQQQLKIQLLTICFRSTTVLFTVFRKFCVWSGVLCTLQTSKLFHFFDVGLPSPLHPGVHPPRCKYVWYWMPFTNGIKWTPALKKKQKKNIYNCSLFWQHLAGYLELWRQDQSDNGSDKQSSEDFLSFLLRFRVTNEGKVFPANPQHLSCDSTLPASES